MPPSDPLPAAGLPPAAVAQLIAIYTPYLRSLADEALSGDLRAKADPSDLVQDALAEAVRGAGEFRGQTADTARAWMARILERVALNFARKHRACQKRAVGREAPPASLEAVPADDPTPSWTAARREEGERRRAALGRLPDDYARVIELHFYENRPFPDVAAAMGRGEDAVRKLWARAVRRWKAALEEAGDWPPG